LATLLSLQNEIASPGSITLISRERRVSNGIFIFIRYFSMDRFMGVKAVNTWLMKTGILVPIVVFFIFILIGMSIACLLLVIVVRGEC
jgi:hypothetical protein